MQTYRLPPTSPAEQSPQDAVHLLTTERSSGQCLQWSQRSTVTCQGFMHTLLAGRRHITPALWGNSTCTAHSTHMWTPACCRAWRLAASAEAACFATAAASRSTSRRAAPPAASSALWSSAECSPSEPANSSCNSRASPVSAAPASCAGASSTSATVVPPARCTSYECCTCAAVLRDVERAVRGTMGKQVGRAMPAVRKAVRLQWWQAADLEHAPWARASRHARCRASRVWAGGLRLRGPRARRRRRRAAARGGPSPCRRHGACP